MTDTLDDDLHVQTFYGDTAVLRPHEPRSHFERFAVGARRGDDGAVPVFIHMGPEAHVGLDQDALEVFGDLDTFCVNRLRLRARLSCHNVPAIIATLHDDNGAGRGNGTLRGYVEEYAGGVSLPMLLQATRAGAAPIGIALAIARTIADVFCVLEERAPGERMTIDPEDVFIGPDGVVRTLLEPFPGWSQMSAGAATGVMRDNFRYLSPEQIRGIKLTMRAPMFSLGVVLFELLTGAHPAGPPGSAIQTLRFLMENPIPSLPSRRADCPAPVAHIVERLVRKAEAERFATWADVVAAIHAAGVRTEYATARDVAAFTAALLPKETQQVASFVERVALLDLDGITRPTTPSKLVEAPPSTTLRSLYDRDDHGDDDHGDDHHDDDHHGDDPGAEAAATWEMRTPPEVDAPFLGDDGVAMWPFNGPFGEELLVDARPVTHDAWARFCIAVGRPAHPSWNGPVPPPELADIAVTHVSAADAYAYARHYKKTIPSNEQWQSALSALGAARLSVGAVWEWTVTPMPGRPNGFVVRGGRYRDKLDVPSDGSTQAWETDASDDVGFRCVAKRPS